MPAGSTPTRTSDVSDDDLRRFRAWAEAFGTGDCVFVPARIGLALLGELAGLRAERDALVARVAEGFGGEVDAARDLAEDLNHRDELQRLCLSLADRVEKQADLLGRRAEKPAAEKPWWELVQ